MVDKAVNFFFLFCMIWGHLGVLAGRILWMHDYHDDHRGRNFFLFCLTLLIIWYIWGAPWVEAHYG